MIVRTFTKTFSFLCLWSGYSLIERVNVDTRTVTEVRWGRAQFDGRKLCGHGMWRWRLDPSRFVFSYLGNNFRWIAGGMKRLKIKPLIGYVPHPLDSYFGTTANYPSLQGTPDRPGSASLCNKVHCEPT